MTVCVFTGIGAEYPLAPLAAQLRQRGVRCVEFDMEQTPLDPHALQGEPQLTLVTSCHPQIDRHQYRTHYGLDAPLSSVPEQLALLRPKRTCFVPHDLTEPLKPEEIPYVPLFDVMLMPGPEYWWLGEYTAVYDVGWIKAPSPSADPSAARCAALFLPSEIGHYVRIGAEAFIETFLPILRLRPLIKFPEFAGSARIEEALQAAGFQCLPRSVHTGTLIQNAEVVLSNGLSSTIAEAAMAGAETVCLADGVHPMQVQAATFGRLAGVRVLPIADAASDLAARKGGVRRVNSGRTFDYELACRIICGRP